MLRASEWQLPTCTLSHHQEAESHGDSLKQQELRGSPDGAICQAHSVEDRRKVLYVIWGCPVSHLFKQRPTLVNHDDHCNAKRSARLVFVYQKCQPSINDEVKNLCQIKSICARSFTLLKGQCQCQSKLGYRMKMNFHLNLNKIACLLLFFH